MQLTRPRRGGGKDRALLRTHTGALDAADVVEIGPWLLTSPTRTLTDLACTLPLDQAVAAGDVALRQGLDPRGSARGVDGRVKYSRLLRPGERRENVVWREKLREDAFRR